MNMVRKLLLVIGSMAIVSFSQIASGTVDKNFQFKDLEGKSYDLFEILGAGKHVALHMTFNGWSSCGPAVAGNNKVFNFFKKNTGGALVFENNILTGDSKQSFIDWMKRWKAELPGISSGEGGVEFSNGIYGNTTKYGGPKYIIKPDKSFVLSRDLMGDLKKLVEQTDLLSQKASTKNIKPKITKISKVGFYVAANKGNTYTFSIYTGKGRLLGKITEKISQNENVFINTADLKFTSGVFFIKISTSTNNFYHCSIIQ